MPPYPSRSKGFGVDHSYDQFDHAVLTGVGTRAWDDADIRPAPPSAMPTPPPRKNFGLRLPEGLIDAISAAALAQQKTRTEIVESAIAEYLGVDAPAMPSTMESRLEALESRLEALEQRLAPPNTTPSTTPNEPQNEPQNEPPCNVTGNVTATPNEAPNQPPSTTPSEPPSTTPSEAHTGLFIAEALIAARAPITEAQARGGNRDRIMRSRTGQTARGWLEGQGWLERSRRWVQPTSR